MFHQLLNDHRGVADFLTFISAGVAVASLAQAAVILTIVSTIIAIVLGGYRLHDRIRYGPAGKGE